MPPHVFAWRMPRHAAQVRMHFKWYLLQGVPFSHFQLMHILQVTLLMPYQQMHCLHYTGTQALD